MKNLILVLALLLSNNLIAQNDTKYSNVFFRVYDLEGNKIAKGKTLAISESSLKVKTNDKPIEIPIANIGFIKTKRSGGNNVIVGAGIGATVGSFTTVSNDGGPQEAMPLPGAIAGAAVGTAVGGITILFKKSKTVQIGGDYINFLEFKRLMTRD